MKNLESRLNTILNLIKNMPSCLDTYDLDRQTKAHSQNIKSLNSKIQTLTAKFESLCLEIKQTRTLLTKINATQVNYNNLICDYDSIKTLSTAFINMKRTVKYAIKIQNSESQEKVTFENYRKKDKLLWKLIFYSKDLDKPQYLQIKPVIDQIQKEFTNFESHILSVADSFFKIEDETELENVLEIVNIANAIDEESLLAKKGRDAAIREPKKEYFMCTFDEKTFKFHITHSLIANHSNDPHHFLKKTDVSFCRVFYAENPYLAHRTPTFLKFRFIKNLMHNISKQEIVEFIPILKKLFHFHYFSKKTEYSIFYFIHLFLIQKLNKEYKEASEILSVIHFQSSYNKLLRKENIFFKEDLINTQFLKSEYLSKIKSKLSIWIENITSAEIKQIKERETIPNRDEEDHFISSNFINLLKIVKETLEPVSFDFDLYNFVVMSIIQNIKHFKESILQILDSEYQKNILNTTSGFEEYCISVGNSGLKLTQYISSLSECDQLIEANKSVNTLSDLGEIFLSITQHTNSLLSKYIIYTLKPAIKKLFTKSFYDEHLSIIKPIKATLTDFIEDYKETMNEYVFITFLNDLIVHLREAYFNQLIKKKSVVYQTIPEYIEKDEKGINRTISKYCSDENVRIDLCVIIPILKVSSTDSFISELQKILYEVELKKEFVKSLIKKRSDLNADEKRELSDAVSSLYNEKGPKRKGFFGGYV